MGPDGAPGEHIGFSFSEDSSYCLLCSLEVLDEQGNLKRKADMFTRRTIRPHVAVTSVDTASEALAVSISEKARVDMDYMAELSGKSPEELEKELAGVIYRDCLLYTSCSGVRAGGSSAICSIQRVMSTAISSSRSASVSYTHLT